MDGRTFAKFHIDVGAGDVVLDPADEVHGRDGLGFAGIPAPAFPVISKEQQFAEKVHAYTRPRERAPNSRVRDRVDLYLLVRLGLDSAATRAVLVISWVPHPDLLGARRLFPGCAGKRLSFAIKRRAP